MFFIVGVERSGTTLLRLLLDAHSQIAIPFETMVLIDFAKRIATDFNELRTQSDKERLAMELLDSQGIRLWNPAVSFDDLDLADCRDYADIVTNIFSVYAAKLGKTVWGDKSPTYESHLHLLSEIFPNAKFINLIRDGRDVVQSLMRQPWGPNSFFPAFDRWTKLVDCSGKMGLMLPQNRYLEIQYEHLVSEPEKVIQSIFDFLEIPNEEDVLTKFNEDLGKKLPAVSQQFHSNLRKSIDTSLSFKWRRNMRKVDQTLAYEIAGDLFEELGYPSGHVNSPRMLVFLRKLYWLFHEAIIWRLKKIKS